MKKTKMRLNFKKISAIATSALMIGMTAGIATAANYPAPFVQSGAADYAVVYGSSNDAGAATNINEDLKSSVTSVTSVGFANDEVSLDTSNTRIYLNSSLNTAKQTLTKSDLPNVLKDYTFSGDVESKMTSTLKIGSGSAAGGDNSNKVIFARQPTSNDDPVIGISLGSNSATALYNASVTMPAINFTHASSQGEPIILFGRNFVVSTESTLTDLILFKSAQEISLVAGGNNPTPSSTVTIDGVSYTITLVSGSGTSSAIINVNGEQRSINAGSSRKIAGLEVALKDVTESTALSTITATLLLGSQKLTFIDGQKVLVGSDQDPIDGTIVTRTGASWGATTGLSVAVFRPSSSDDAILEGQSFVDPVFESFQVKFTGLSESLSSSDRETLSVKNSGDKTMSLTFTDSLDNTKTIDFAYNESSAFKLRDSVNETIHVRDKLSMAEGEYIVLGNQDYGALVELTRIYNNTGTAYTNDRVTFKNVMSGETYDAVFTAEGTGTVSINGKQYTVKFTGDSDTGSVVISHADAGADTVIVAYPTIQTKNGGKLLLYEPLTINMSNVLTAPTTIGSLTKIKIPDGDGYTDVNFAYDTTNTGHTNWTISGAGAGTLSSGNLTSSVDLTIGELTYTLTGTSGINVTTLKLKTPASVAMSGPAVVLLEGRDDSSKYEAVIVQLEESPAGTSTDGVGVNAILMSSPTQWSATKRSDTDVIEYVNWWGTYASLDASDSDQKIADISYPGSQVYAQISVGDIGESSTGSAGGLFLMDSETAQYANKNVIVVGGSCINTAAAKLLGSTTPLCGEAWTAKTNVGAGQFIIKGYAGSTVTTKHALLVAGYETADTNAAAEYLMNNAVDTSAETIKTTTSVASTI